MEEIPVYPRDHRGLIYIFVSLISRQFHFIITSALYEYEKISRGKIFSPSLSLSLSQVVDYTIPYYKDNGFTIMMRRDNKTIPFLWFITILDHHVWLNFIVAFLVTSILIYLFERYSPLSYTNAPERYRDEPDPRFASLRGCLWFCAMSLTPNGGGATPKNLSGKLAAVIWWTFGLIIVAAYSANLAAYRTLDRLERHIQTIDDLRRQYQVDYSTVIDSPTYRHFESLKANEKVLSK